MDLTTLGRAFGFSFAAGVNLYATVACYSSWSPSLPQ
jgi:hypothetical protein